ncbi:hypothetical protein HOL24_07380 [bacterium]|jgi:hypothetical protein|nr:hypothetical protein [bacterium]
MNHNFLNEVSSRILEIKSFNKKTIFSISTTAKQEENSYMTPIRDCDSFVLTGCIIFDQKILPTLLKKIDGEVDVILVDSEKKIPMRIDNNFKDKPELYKTVGYVETGSISRICFEYIKKSKVFEFKPNDLTVNATWSFLSQRFRFLSGKKISILGAGNIGSKLALKLVECGAEVHLHRRDFYKGHHIVHGLNLIKPEGVIANIHFHQNIMQASFLSDILIGASNGHPVIDSDVVNSVKKSCLIVDLGKNNLTKKAIKIAAQHSVEIYRTDVTPAIESYVHEVLKMQDILENSYGKKELDFCNIISGGFFGGLGDVVVDRINNPKRIIGVAQGDGALKKILNTNDKNNLKKIKSNFSIK